MIILLHSSKTMRSSRTSGFGLSKPLLLGRANELGEYLKTLTTSQIAQAMHISAPLSEKTQTLIQAWSGNPSSPSAAIDSFVGDIYSGLRSGDLSPDDRQYANQNLRILSGLYGILRPFDIVSPYRLEMGYKLPDPKYRNLYQFWSNQIADALPPNDLIINVSSIEYTQAVLPFVEVDRVITPKFLTVNAQTRRPTFVVVHAKIARGAFARWLITSRAQDASKFNQFADLSYQYDPQLSSASEPTFVCHNFGGLGLSQRLL